MTEDERDEREEPDEPTPARRRFLEELMLERFGPVMPPDPKRQSGAKERK